MRTLTRYAALLPLVLALTAGCLAAEPLAVAVSILPQKYFVERIGGDAVRVTVMVPPGADPHGYEPRPRQLTELSTSRLYLAIGVDFERAWLKRLRAANPRLTVVRTDDGVPKRPMAPGAGHAHAVGGHRHGSGEPDPHVWLNPTLVKILCGNILRALVASDPGNRTAYEERCARFLEDVEALDAELKAVFADRQGTRFIVLHPAWGYFADAYGLEQIAIEIEGKEPKPAQLRDLIRKARELGITAVFVQPQFSAKTAELVAREIGGQVIAADDLAENWPENLRATARRLRAALK
jgi:zinc transport system substrate-binding protein